MSIAALFAACANAQGTSSDGGSMGSGDGGGSGDASCGTMCDQDHDGVVDGLDLCPSTASGATVNNDGCAEEQLTWTLESFPPFGLTWTPAGDPGRAGGVTWTYTGIEREDLFHIVWVVCDDPGTPCGLSLDGPIQAATENWAFSPTDSDLLAGKLVLTNTTHIVLDNGSMPMLDGRYTITITDSSDMPIRWAAATTMGVTTRLGQYLAEITTAGFKVTMLGEVKDSTAVWTPYAAYYDAASTPVVGGGVTSSIGGSFYSK